MEYKVNNNPEELLTALTKGKKIQRLTYNGEWVDIDNYSNENIRLNEIQYRVKPYIPFQNIEEFVKGYTSHSCCFRYRKKQKPYGRWIHASFNSITNQGVSIEGLDNFTYEELLNNDTYTFEFTSGNPCGNIYY